MGHRFATDMARKVDWLLCPFLHNVAWVEAYPVPSDILIHPTVWPQYTNVIGRTDRRMVP